MKRAALDPGVQEFAEIVRDANRLRDRVAEFLRQHDGQKETDSMLKLDIATRGQFDTESQVPELLRNLWALHFVAETTSQNLTGPLNPTVFPMCFE